MNKDIHAMLIKCKHCGYTYLPFAPSYECDQCGMAQTEQVPVQQDEEARTAARFDE